MNLQDYSAFARAELEFLRPVGSRAGSPPRSAFGIWPLLGIGVYSETRVAVSRKHYSKVDATIRERRPGTKLTRLQGLSFRSNGRPVEVGAIPGPKSGTWGTLRGNASCGQRPAVSSGTFRSWFIPGPHIYCVPPAAFVGRSLPCSGSYWFLSIHCLKSAADCCWTWPFSLV